MSQARQIQYFFPNTLPIGRERIRSEGLSFSTLDPQSGFVITAAGRGKNIRLANPLPPAMGLREVMGSKRLGGGGLGSTASPARHLLFSGLDPERGLFRALDGIPRAGHPRHLPRPPVRED